MRPRTLRARFILIVVLGAVLPLALVGVWMSRSTERAGRALLQSQLESAAGAIVARADRQWNLRAGEIQLLANNTVAQRLLGGAALARDLRDADSIKIHSTPTLVVQDRLPEAIDAFKQSHAADPSYLHPLFAMANIYVQLGLQNQVSQVLESLQQANRGNLHPRTQEIELVARDLERLRRGERVIAPGQP